jgi:2',3'-cyclic-nucleotide 2'-phosphodiesterase (5'-nucleotidase family)
VVLFALRPCQPVAAETTRLTFVLICDVYKMEDTRGRGGLARIAAALKAERANGRHVLIAHAGDAISPSLLSGMDRGAHMIDLLNDLPLDVFVPGNHEFDFGPEIFAERMAEAKFPI